MKFKPEHIERFNELFLLTRKRYIYQSPKTKGWITLDNLKNEKHVPFNDSLLKRHLEGKGAYGVFSSENIVKFITFDVDCRDDMQRARWISLKIIDTIISMGIPDKYIYVSFSGSKGYHVDIYFNKPIKSSLAKEFYLMILAKADCTDKEVEFRPDKLKYGVKLPLGIHQKTGKRCWYVDYYNYFKPIKTFDYILKIQQIDVSYFCDLLDRETDSFEEEEIIEVEERILEISTKTKQLDIYKNNLEEKETLETIENILSTGLQRVGTRHKVCFNIAKYFRYQGFSEMETLENLNIWMASQDESKYSTELEDCYKDNELIVQYVYEKEISLTSEKRNLQILYDEMKVILELKTFNQKLIAYCLLIHSKRFADQQGVFYMSFKQLSEASGLVEKTCRTIVSQLEEIKALEIVARNQMVKDKKGAFVWKKPNKYKMLVKGSENEKYFELEINTIRYQDQFKRVVNTLFSNTDLKNTLPRRQYEKFVVGGNK